MNFRDVATPDCEWDGRARNRFTNRKGKLDDKRFWEDLSTHFKERGPEALLEYEHEILRPERIKQEACRLITPQNQKTLKHYEYFFIKYALILSLLEAEDFRLPKNDLVKKVQDWETDIRDQGRGGNYEAGDMLFVVARAAAKYNNDILPAEMNLTRCIMETHNEQVPPYRTKQYGWMHFCRRLAASGNFPKIGGGQHSAKEVRYAIYRLEDQALVYETKKHHIGLFDETVSVLSDWAHFELSADDYEKMLDILSGMWIGQGELITAQEKLLGRRKGNSNKEKQRDLIDNDVFPSDLLRISLDKDQLKDIADTFGIPVDARRKPKVLAQSIVQYFRGWGRPTPGEEGQKQAELYLSSYLGLAQRQQDDVDPGIVKELVSRKSDNGKTKDMLQKEFEKATAKILTHFFHLDDVKWLGGGNEPDGIIGLSDLCIIWDNKARQDERGLRWTTDLKRQVEDYIRSQQSPTCRICLIIAPQFRPGVEDRVAKLSQELGPDVDIALVTAERLKAEAENWEYTDPEESAQQFLALFANTQVYD